MQPDKSRWVNSPCGLANLNNSWAFRQSYFQGSLCCIYVSNKENVAQIIKRLQEVVVHIYAKGLFIC